MEPLHFYGYMTLGAQHGHMEEVVVEEAGALHPPHHRGRGRWQLGRAEARLRAPGRAAEAGGDQARQVGVQESVRTRRGRFELIINAEVGSSLDTTARGWTVVWAWHQDTEVWLVASAGEGITGAGSLSTRA